MSEFPIHSLVYVYDDQTPACVVSHGKVSGVLLQFAPAAFLFKVKTAASVEIIDTKRLRFRNGCPVNVRYPSDNKDSQMKTGEGIILGSCDIPAGDNRRGELTGDTFWYSVHILDGERIMHEVSPSQVKYREVEECEDDENVAIKIEANDDYETPTGSLSTTEIPREIAVVRTHQSMYRINVKEEPEIDSIDETQLGSLASASTVVPPVHADVFQREEIINLVNVKVEEDPDAMFRSDQAVIVEKIQKSVDVSPNCSAVPTVVGRSNESSSTIHSGVASRRSIEKIQKEIGDGDVSPNCSATRTGVAQRSNESSSTIHSAADSRRAAPSEKVRSLGKRFVENISMNTSATSRCDSQTMVNTEHSLTRQGKTNEALSKEWRFVPPRLSESYTKYYKDKKFHWCGKCGDQNGEWVLHHEDEHDDNRRRVSTEHDDKRRRVSTEPSIQSTNKRQPREVCWEINKDYRADLFQRIKDDHVSWRILKQPSMKIPPSSWNKYISMCVTFHVRGQCMSNCKRSQDHRTITDDQAKKLLRFCEEQIRLEEESSGTLQQAPKTAYNGKSSPRDAPRGDAYNGKSSPRDAPRRVGRKSCWTIVLPSVKGKESRSKFMILSVYDVFSNHSLVGTRICNRPSRVTT